jgi:predicted transglutaminase-like cysteine proteinase
MSHVSQLEELNREINQLPYVSDSQQYNTREFWALLTESGGDCEDYVLTKIKRLLELGWPIQDLRVACVYTETNEYHAVLVVSAPDQDYMLDSRMDELVPVSQLTNIGYRTHKIQHQGGSDRWVEWLS